MTQSPKTSPRIILLGASAGGLTPIKEVLEAFTEESPDTFVIIQHLLPDHESMLEGILKNSTDRTIHTVEDAVQLSEGSIYIIAPGKFISIEQDYVVATPMTEGQKHRSDGIDYFLSSLDLDIIPRVTAVILSGNGKDGTRGCARLREHGGSVVAQDPLCAEFSSMPHSIVTENLADFTGTPEEIAQWLKDSTTKSARYLSSKDTLKLQEFVENSQHRALAAYKPSSLQRRIEYRMSFLNIKEVERYLALLESSSDEQDALSKALLVQVTRFYRDPASFDSLFNNYFERLLESLEVGQALRVWVPGCCTGQEAYTLAFMIMDKLRDLDKRNIDFRIFATDLSRESLNYASNGVYTTQEVESLKPSWFNDYFKPYNDSYIVREGIRRHLTFAVHDLAYDPPYSGIHLVSCRNVLIYFHQSVQERILNIFHYALVPEGVLFLGSSEGLGKSLGTMNNLDPKHRIFSRQNTKISVESLFDSSSDWMKRTRDQRQQRDGSWGERTSREELHGGMFSALASCLGVKGLLMSRNFFIEHFFGDLSEIIEYTPGRVSFKIDHVIQRDVGFAIKNLAAMAIKKGNGVSSTVAVNLKGRDTAIELKVVPVEHEDAAKAFFVFVKVGDIDSPEQLEKTTLEASVSDSSLISDLEYQIEDLKREIGIKQKQLQEMSEEHQAMHEEINSTNEELQSSNEELQSTNEELYTLNTEFRNKIDSLLDANRSLEFLLNSIHAGIIFLGPEFEIRRFNPYVLRFASLIPQDIGRCLFDIRFKGLGSQLDTKIQVYREEGELERAVTLETGKVFASLIPLPNDPSESDSSTLALVISEESHRHIFSDTL